ncbi:helix-turn-helix domain-containing protein [Streptantibioticus ferralitis]|uniref:Helix-turn-helix transcriptional regulator n=1 Tax=Streptantibioticus ferralitis TaxID=236510 RepID=A0ABT5YW29_9ACTN|nr:helix-turn-helix transcriptional regulator [Streptantibioticus ferralitis]MDF2255802.1 helix-turn-helix transcriptional regulator [Streptantibioticus ferralitis]
MPPRSNPTARQVRLGAELRKMRERAGITARDAAAYLNSNPIQMSHVESGRSGISEERIRRLAGHYACDNLPYVDALVDMANERGKGWWEEFRGTLSPVSLDLAEMEHHAAYLRALEVIHIPGLLQTEGHMRAAFSYVNPNLPAHRLDTWVEFRARRKTVLTTGTFNAVIHEAALRLRVGGAVEARAQLAHILELSERDNVSVRIIPFDVEGFAGAGYSMLYAGGRVSQLDTVQIDTMDSSNFLDAESRLTKFRELLDRIESSALMPGASRDLIRRIEGEL